MTVREMRFSDAVWKKARNRYHGVQQQNARTFPVRLGPQTKCDIFSTSMTIMTITLMKKIE